VVRSGMNLGESLRVVVNEHAPCIAVAVRIGEERDGGIGSGAALESSADGLETHRIIHGLAVMKHVYAVACERYAKSLGIAENNLHTLIAEHYNTLRTDEK
jgi:hypothetical protein